MSPGNARTEVLQLLGLAHRAGAVRLGTGAVRESIRGGRTRVVLTADDGSATQLAKLRPLLEHRVEVREWRIGSRAEIGAALGRSRVTAVAIEDDGFATRIRELLDS